MFISRLEDCEEFIAGDRSVLRELLHPDKADLAIRYSLAHATVKPGAKTTPHRLRTAEVYYILQGRGRMHIDAEVADVTCGCAIHIPPQATQYIENPSDTDLVFLCMVDPAWRLEDEEILPSEHADGGRIAVDVVLLPDDTMMDKAIEINGRIAAEGSDEILLNRTDRLPHISLAMGCIDPKTVAGIRETLEKFARENPVKRLTATGIDTSVNSRGQTTCLLAIERTEELHWLHERVLEEMERFFSHDTAGVRFYDDPVSETTLDWVRNYPRKAGYERFDPHITLGYGRPPSGFSFPFEFAPSRLALCHLGNHATCRRVLAALVLSAR
jgi:mannose-6-phosphate isomerase-like protein (cupin superfamily)/2'-5' RNA ligase